MSRIARRALAVAALTALTTGAWSLEVALEYQRHDDSCFMLKSAKPPPGKWKLPDLKSDTPVYLLADLPGGKRLLVLDRQAADAKFYDRLYYDANGNRDLTDDPSFKPTDLRAGMAGFTDVKLGADKTYNLNAYHYQEYAYGMQQPAATAEKPAPLTGQKLVDALQVSTYSPARSAYQASSYSYPTLELGQPEGDWKLPKLHSEQPVHSFLELGEKKCLLLMDRRNADDVSYNRLYLDANGNRDLTDDPPVDGNITVRGSSYVGMEFPSVELKIEVDGQLLRYCMQPRGYLRSRTGEAQPLRKEDLGSAFRLLLRATCSYKGEFEQGGKKYQVLLGDGNGNGLFSDRMTLDPKVASSGARPTPQGDQFFIKAAGETLSSYDAFKLGDLLYLDGRTQQVEIKVLPGKKSAPRLALRLTPPTAPLVKLAVAAKTERLSLYSKDGKHGVMALNAGKEIPVPAGEYGFFSYHAVKEGEKGDSWRLIANAAKSDSLARAGAADTPLRLGEPYTVKAQVPEYAVKNFASSSQKSVSLSFVIAGAGGETIRDLSKVSGDASIAMSKKSASRPAEPTYRIVKAGGEQAARGNFEYG